MNLLTCFRQKAWVGFGSLYLSLDIERLREHQEAERGETGEAQRPSLGRVKISPQPRD